MVITYHLVHSALGPILVATHSGKICFAQFGDSDAELLSLLQQAFVEATLAPAHRERSLFGESLDRIVELLIHGRNPLTAREISVTPHGTPFQVRVWDYLQSIPCGETRSYQDVAAGIGYPSATRAVASACAKNKIALFIPCHRVIRSDGSLGGYRWGMQKKRALLEAEQWARQVG